MVRFLTYFIVLKKYLIKLTFYFHSTLHYFMHALSGHEIMTVSCFLQKDISWVTHSVESQGRESAEINIVPPLKTWILNTYRCTLTPHHFFLPTYQANFIPFTSLKESKGCDNKNLRHVLEKIHRSSKLKYKLLPIENVKNLELLSYKYLFAQNNCHY